MRSAFLVVALLLAGCATPSGDPSGSPTSQASASASSTAHAPAATANGTAHSAPNATMAPAATNTTVATNATAPMNATVPHGPVARNACSGELPEPDFLVASPTCQLAVPAGADAVSLFYNTTFTGLFSANVALSDGSGKAMGSTLDACGIPTGAPAADFHCRLDVLKGVTPGDWVAEVQFQAGEVKESYTLVLVAYGPV